MGLQPQDQHADGAAPRVLTVFLPVDGARADVFRTMEPGTWLPAPLWPHAGGWVVRLHAGPASHWVVCHVGAASLRDGALWRPITWRPSDRSGDVRRIDRLLPVFTGDLGLMLNPQPTFVLTGSYQPPGAALGTTVDRAGLERVAQASARRLVADIAKRIGPAPEPQPQEGPLALRQ